MKSLLFIMASIGTRFGLVSDGETVADPLLGVCAKLHTERTAGYAGLRCCSMPRIRRRHRDRPATQKLCNRFYRPVLPGA